MTSHFLDSLNPEQRQAVEKIFGPVLVVAGPGTGKTHLLTARIAHILSTADTNPENILCLTFTESGAAEMKKRLAQWIGPTAYRIRISTFHGFCQWVMEGHPEYFYPRKRDRSVADDLQKALAFKDAIESQKWKYFSDVFDPFFWRGKFLKAISHLKRENISPAKFREMIPAEKMRLEADPENFYKRKTKDAKVGDFKPSAIATIDRKIGQMSELVDLWEVYEAKMIERKIFDFDDQIQWVTEELGKNENLRIDLQERFQWVLVDEYQDTNSSQNQVLWYLTDFFDDPNLFAVGDDDQAIYRFQGASSANIQDFRNRFPQRTEILLRENYRSGQNILDAAFSSIGRNLDRTVPDKNLVAAGKNKNTPGRIVRSEFPSRYAELGSLVHQIRKLLAEGIPPHEIAILVRKNSELAEIASELPKFGIPVAAEIFENIFDDENVGHLIRMLEIFSDPSHDEKLIDLLHAPFFSVSAETIFQLSRQAQKEKISVMEILLSRAESDPALKKVLDFFLTTRKDYLHCRAGVIVEKLLHESGLAQFVSESKEEVLAQNWQKVKKFIEWVRASEGEMGENNLSEILKRIDLHRKLKISLRPDPVPADRRAIRVMTAHKAKGKEFDVVFIPGLLDHVWGNCRAHAEIALPELFKSHHEENSDERRLFFVALTRARKQVFLSYSQNDFAGREKNVSQFWHELPENLCETFSADQADAEIQKLLPIFLSSPETPLLAESEKSVLEEATKNFIWSATSLQNYLDCPRKFLYLNIFKIPRKPILRLSSGVAMHEALEKTLREFSKTGKLPEEAFLLAQFERALRGQNLPQSDFQNLLAHGAEVLKNYFSQKKDTLPQDALLEFNVRKNSPGLEIDGIPVTGKIDRVEFLSPEKKSAVLIDYKSGTPKYIKSGDRFWRQLVFYDLLVRSARGISWEVDSCALEFLTPDKKTGKLERKKYIISDLDREKVAAELREADRKIKNLEFPFVPNLEKDSEIEYWQNFGKRK